MTVVATGLPERQTQVMRELDVCECLGEPTTAARLARLMFIRHGVGKSQTYDLLGALHRKGVLELVDGQWRRTEAA